MFILIDMRNTLEADPTQKAMAKSSQYFLYMLKTQNSKQISFSTKSIYDPEFPDKHAQPFR